MPAGYATRCKVCNSLHRIQIESWIKDDGLSYRVVSKKILDEFGERISYSSIQQHMADHYNVMEDVREQYEKSKAQMEQEVAKRVNEIQVLDNIIYGKFRLHKTLELIISNRLAEMPKSGDLPKFPQAYAYLYNNLAAEICRAIKTKQEVLGEDAEAKKAEAIESLSEAEIDVRLEELFAIIEDAKDADNQIC